MQNTATVSKHTISFGLSLALCAVLNAFLVIAKETSQAVASWMQRITGHHWITHVALILIPFALLGWLFARTNRGQGPRMPVHRLTPLVLAGVVAGLLILLGFYIIAD
jgi:heme/copper-type cytochrome/quinol oxidase subunit 4